MRDADRGAIPLVDVDRRLVGIVTDRDLVVRLAADEAHGWNKPASTVMTPDPARCRPTDSVQHALGIMKAARVGRLPVVDASGVLVGILSINDVVLGAQNVRAGQARVSYLRAGDGHVVDAVRLAGAGGGAGVTVVRFLVSWRLT